MERNSNKVLTEFPPANLYIDDLAEVIKAFNEGCQHIEVTAGEYKITDSNELEALAAKFPGDRFPDVKIQGKDPYLSVDFRPYEIQAYISESSLNQLGIISKVREIIKGRKKLRADFTLNVIYFAAIAVGTWQLLNTHYFIGALIIGSGFVTIPFSVRRGMKNNVIIYTKRRNEVRGFLERKKDDLVLAGISALLGAVFSYALTTYLK